MIVQLIPYLHFDGTCEEAFLQYKKIFGGDFEVMYRYDNPSIKMKSIGREKILHAEFRISERLIFYGCDFYPDQKVMKGNAEPAISLLFDDKLHARDSFHQLTQGGTVLLPFEKQFWGSMHGQVIDRFGIKWMINL